MALLHTAPAEAHSAAAEVLAGLDPTRREAFGLRLDRWYEDLISGLEHVYPEHNCAALALALVRHAAAAYRDRDPELHREVCDRIRAWVDAQPGWHAAGLIESPIHGADGNVEFLIAARREW